MPPSFNWTFLGLPTVAALTPDHWDITIWDENFKKFKYQEADLVGLTAKTPTATRAYEIARMYRERGIPTVLGGIHATACPDEAANYVDTVVIGEAESVWPQVISDFEAGSMQKIYRGEWLELERMVKPRRDLLNPKYAYGTVQSSRGCPNDCEFCACNTFYGGRYRLRPVDEVLDEIEEIPQKRFFFVEDNLMPNVPGAEERALALFHGMIERGIKKDWSCYNSMNFASNEEVLEKAAESGCRLVMLGVEAEDTDALSEVNKKLNLEIGINSYEDIFRRIHQHGIGIMGLFVYGMDSDTPDKLRRRTEYILNSSVDIVEITPLTPLPGTRLMNRLEKEGRLLYINYPEDWDRYDITQCLYHPAQMTVEEYKGIIRESTRRIYSFRTLLHKFLMTWRETGRLSTAFNSLLANFNFRLEAKLAIRRMYSD